MRSKFLFWFIIAVFALSSCHKNVVEEPKENDKTLFMYLPYSYALSYSTNYEMAPFIKNVADLEAAVEQMGGLDGRRVIVFFANSSSTADMFEITYKQGQCVRDTFKTYTNLDCTTEAGLTGIFNDMKAAAPATTYSIVIGGHGMAWLPIGADPTRAKGRKAQQRYHWQEAGEIQTRFFGDDDSGSTTDISTLANSLSNCGIKADYILFDDCYMSSIEVAYDLRDVTDYLIACPTEIMAYGMPYKYIGSDLLNTQPDYAAICQSFYDFYSTYRWPYGTIGVTYCRRLDDLAAFMKYANSLYAFDRFSLESIQRMDGYTPVLFYDFGDYVRALCGNDTAFMTQFQAMMNEVVPYKANTEKYYTALLNDSVTIATYSGITTSEPSTNVGAKTYTTTSWYQATH